MLLNLRSALKASVSLETLRNERDHAYQNHMRAGENVDKARRALEEAERAARLTRRRWLDLGVKINELEKESIGSGNSR